MIRINTKTIEKALYNYFCKNIATIDRIQGLSARELYDFLELDSKNWSRWYKHNIEANDFFEENSDYQGLFIAKNCPIKKFIF